VSFVRSSAVERWGSLLEELSWTKRFAFCGSGGTGKGLCTILVPGKKSKRVKGPPRIM